MILFPENMNIYLPIMQIYNIKISVFIDEILMKI